MGKVAFVTGADRGLGYSMTITLLQEGYSVFAGRYMEDWGSLDEAKKEYGEKITIVPLDIGSDESVTAALAVVTSMTSHLDLLINNAGITDAKDQATVLDEMDFEVMSRIYTVNTLGPLRVSHAFMELLLQGQDKLIVNVSSEAGSIARNQRVNMYGYCMSKSALNMQSSILHQQLRKEGGQVMVYYPGWLKSYMSGTLSEEALVSPDESASKLMNLIKNHKSYDRNQPVFLDLDGVEWPW
ncbi:SDR family oxidoreductase [Paenibacillus sp. Marseille-Q4541]|uniref:SDR family oxidoreductase n=1 Tax=Paenibacillus sp. Marseille-Q4541 TaxID=2831522 RepID=UPI001BADF1F1|nr:SDR family oxidoreductase [Paenibacillus sp. Marseille-Q4541]